MTNTIPEWATPQWALSATPSRWPQWSLAVDGVALMLDQEGELTVGTLERHEAPYKDMKSLIGGFVGWQEKNAEVALERIYSEKGGLQARWTEALGTFDINGRDPRQWIGRQEPEGWVALGSRVTSEAYVSVVDKFEGHQAGVYDFLPWEDNRYGATFDQLTQVWVGRSKVREARVGELMENDELCLARFDLLLEAGVLAEAARDKWGEGSGEGAGRELAFDHRRMLAAALGRLRGKARYDMKVVRALVGDKFVWGRLVHGLESVWGNWVHGANLRRIMVDTEQFRVLAVTDVVARSGSRGRPAGLYEFIDGGRRLTTSIHVPWGPARGLTLERHEKV